MKRYYVNENDMEIRDVPNWNLIPVYLAYDVESEITRRLAEQREEIASEMDKLSHEAAADNTRGTFYHNVASLIRSRSASPESKAPERKPLPLEEIREADWGAPLEEFRSYINALIKRVNEMEQGK